MTLEELAKMQREYCLKIVADAEPDDNKSFGECESCGQETVLVSDVGMCGPCTFGEANTLNGNW